MIAVRDSKDPSGPVLKFSPQEWQEFISSGSLPLLAATR